MELEIFWTQFAENKLKDIFNYYKSRTGIKIAKKIATEIIDKTLKLNKNPKIGQIEDYLINRNHKFRYLISTNYKIIYYINLENKRIIIANVFDVRQNPLKLNETE